jgi:hypothetical protein
MRPRRSEKAESTIQVQHLRWGLRIGMFADNGPSTGLGHKPGAQVRRSRSRVIATSLAGAAGVFVAGIVYGLVYGLLKDTVASGGSPSREGVASVQPEVGTPQRRVRVAFPQVPRHNEADPQIKWSEPETRVARASSATSPPPTRVSFIPVSGLAFDAPVTPTQPRSLKSREQPRSGKIAAFAKRALDQSGVPTSAKPGAQPKRDRSVRRSVYKHDRATTTDIDILSIILGDVPKGAWSSAGRRRVQVVQLRSSGFGNRRAPASSLN